MSPTDYVDVAGRLYRSPGREPDRDVLFIDVRTVGARGEERPVRGHLRLSVPFARGVRPRLDFVAGDTVRASVRLSSGGAFRNFGAFSYERYLQGLNVHRRASTKTSLLVERTPPARRASIRRRISRVRRFIQAELERRFPAPDGKDISPAGAVLEALLLGEDGRLDEPTVENLRQTGLYHLFAISGGHIAIINVLLFSLFRLVRMSRRASGAALGLFLVFYTLLVEGSPSVLRATLMTLAFLAGRLLWKDVHVLNTISASAFALLLVNPSSLFDAGFQLTYVATLSIVLFTPPLLRRLPRLPLRLTELALLSVTAALGAAPIIARSFNRVTLSSLVLNFAAIPLVGLIMGVGYAYLPFAAAFPGAAAVPGRGARAPRRGLHPRLPFARRVPVPLVPRPDAAPGRPRGLFSHPRAHARPAALPGPARGRPVRLSSLRPRPRRLALPAVLARAHGHPHRRRTGRVDPRRVPGPPRHAHRRRRPGREPFRRRREGRFAGPLAQGHQEDRHAGPHPSPSRPSRRARRGRPELPDRGILGRARGP